MNCFDPTTNWPMLDFSLFPNNEISGLTLEEINEVIAKQPETSGNSERNNRFASPISDNDLQQKYVDSIPKGTKKRNKWAINQYEMWAKQRQLLPGESVDYPLPKNEASLKEATVEALDYWMAKFIFEIRKKDGSVYRRESLISIIAGINAFFNSSNRNINFFKDECFTHFRQTLDLSCQESSKIPHRKRQADVISHSAEEKMWSDGVLGDDEPEKLINTLLFLNGLHFALRSGQEHRSLSIDQISIIPPSETCKYYCLEYIETVSKTNNGGFKTRIDPKQVKHVDVQSLDNPQRSHVSLLRKYLSLRPPNSCNAFYLTPLKSDQRYWYKVSIDSISLYNIPYKRLISDLFLLFLDNSDGAQ